MITYTVLCGTNKQSMPTPPTTALNTRDLWAAWHEMKAENTQVPEAIGQADLDCLRKAAEAEECKLLTWNN